MQALKGHQQETSLICSECSTQFKSASLLLKHFAKHITFSKKNDCKTEMSFRNTNTSPRASVLFCSEEEDKTESILEKVLHQSVLSNSQMNRLGVDETTVHDSSSSTSEYCTSTSSDNDISFTEQRNRIPQTVIEIEDKLRDTFTSTTDIKLVKCDLQKRLENCILKLALKRDSRAETVSDSLQIGLQLKQPQGTRDLSIKNNNDSEDFNPLKFCIVTMEEGEEKLELSDAENHSEKTETSPNTSKSTSNRKQQSPKKIPNLNENAEVMMEALKIGVNERSTVSLHGKKKYPCPVCWKVFGWSTDLKRHILTHTGERPFKCQLCTATFTRNFLLQKHEAKVHSGLSLVNLVAQSADHMEVGNVVPAPQELLITGATIKTETTQGSPTKRKRTIVQPTWDKKQMIHNLGKKLQKLQDCHSIPYSLLSQKDLNIS